MQKPENELIRNEFLDFYTKYREKLKNETNYKDTPLNGTFYFTDKINLLKVGGCDKILNRIPINFVKDVFDDIARNTIYNYNNNEYDYINFFNADNMGTRDGDNSKFINLINTFIHTYFPKLSYEKNIDAAINKLKTIMSNEYLNYKNIIRSDSNIANRDYLNLLLYRIQLTVQASYAYIYKLINYHELLITGSTNKLVIVDADLNCITHISYLQCDRNNIDDYYSANNIIGKVMKTIKINEINEHAYCVFELNFDLNEKFTITDELPNSKKTAIFKDAIVDYFHKIHTISGSVNILQCLATQSISDTPNSMQSARSNQGGSHSNKHKIDDTGFYDKDVSGYYGENLSKTTCYEKNNTNYCTYNGLLNYYNSNLSVIPCNTSNEIQILDQLKIFFETFNNISSSLIIVSDLATINKLFTDSFISKSKKKSTYRPKSSRSNSKTHATSSKKQYVKRTNLSIVNSSFKSDNTSKEYIPLISNINSLGRISDSSNNGSSGSSDEDYEFPTSIKSTSLLTHPLEFILLKKKETLIYNIKNNKYTEKKINHNILPLPYDIKSYQNVYIIVQSDYEKVNEKQTKLFDPPLSIDGINKMQLFLDTFKKTYKSSFPVIVTSYLSRSILTSSLLNLALPTIMNLGFTTNNNIHSTLQIFMLIYFIRHLKLGKSMNELLNSSGNTTKIGNLDISENDGLQNVLQFILKEENIYTVSSSKSSKITKIMKSPDEIIKQYMSAYIKPIDYTKIYISTLLKPLPMDIELEGGNKHRLTKTRLTKTRLTKTRLTKTRLTKLTKNKTKLQ